MKLRGNVMEKKEEKQYVDWKEAEKRLIKAGRKIRARKRAARSFWMR